MVWLGLGIGLGLIFGVLIGAALAMAILAWLLSPKNRCVMQASDRGRAFVMRQEGVRLKAYQDSVGIWTIGCGHTTAAGAPVVKPGMTITAAECDAILAHDLRKFEGYVRDALPHYPFVQHEFDALVSLCFNIGPGNFKKSSVVRFLGAHKHKEAADAFLAWNKAGGRVLAGLDRRRRDERRLFLTGDYGDGRGKAPVGVSHPVPPDVPRLVDAGDDDTAEDDAPKLKPLVKSKELASGGAAMGGGLLTVLYAAKDYVGDAFEAVGHLDPEVQKKVLLAAGIAAAIAGLVVVVNRFWARHKGVR